MQKSRLYYLITLISLLIFAGLALRSAAILTLSVPLLAYLGAAVYLAPRQAALLAERSLEVRLADGTPQAAPPPEAPERVLPAGSLVTVRVSVKNQGGELSEAVITDGPWGHATSLETGASSEWEYSFTPRRGRLVFPDLEALAGDPFGLFARRVAIPAPTDGRTRGALLTLPYSQPLKRLPLRPPLLRGFAGPVAARRPGSGTDFYGVREYQPGDSPRHLNWRMSSKHEHDLFTNEYEGERFADIGLILDARQSRNLISPGGELFEAGVLAAASLGQTLLRDGHRVSLLVYGFSMERVMPGAGRAQGERLLRALAAARPLHNYALDNLNYLPTRMFPPHSQIVFVSPLAEEDFGPLVRHRALGYDVLVVSPNPVEFEAREISPSGDSEHTLAVRLARIERDLLVRRLERYGVWVVDWAVHRPLGEALRVGLAPFRSGQRLLRY